MSRSLARLLIAVSLLLAPCPGVAASPATAPSAPLPPTPPTRTFTIQQGARRVHLLALDDDGRTAYVFAHVRRINVWRVVSFYWPEAAAAALSLVALRAILRIIRRKRIAGEEYCRKCDYHLRGLESTRCPECGTELTPRYRVRAGGRWSGIAVTSAFLLAVTTAYALTRDLLPRTGLFDHLLDWRSIGLYDWADKHQKAWLTRHVEDGAVLLTFNIDRGRVERVLCRVDGVLDEEFTPLAISDDRTALIGMFSGWRGGTRWAGRYPPWNAAARVDLRSGVVARFDIPDLNDQSWFRASGDGRTFVTTDFRGSRSIVWDLVSGNRLGEYQSPLVRVAAGTLVLLHSSNPYNRWQGLATCRPGAERPDYLAGADCHAWTCAKDSLYVARNEAASVAVETWDVARRQRVDRLVIPGNLGDLVVNGRTALLRLSSDTRSWTAPAWTEVIDLDARRSRGRLGPLGNAVLLPASDGSRIVAGVELNERPYGGTTPPPPSFTGHIAVWDLPEPRPTSTP